MTSALLLFLLVATPEECLVGKGDAAATVTHGGKTYRFRYAECRDEFLTDPERFSQLYDALIELQQSGETVAPPSRPSLVPS